MNCSVARVPNLEFTRETLLIVVCYLVVFVLAFFGNLTMLLILCRNQLTKRRRVHSLLLHMTIAHLIVSLIYVPKEIIHNVTILWHGGDTLCRLCKFFDVFGVALSANILMCLSLDRFYSILFPLYSINAKRSVLRMLVVAWAVAFLSSLPQIYIFRSASHPCFPWYHQCVSADVIGLVSPKVTFWFSVLNIIEVYFLPLLVIVVCYGSILISISMKSGSWRGMKLFKKKNAETNQTSGQALLRRAGGQDNFERAKSRTFQMTVVVVSSFLLCWTPYTIAMFIHFLRSSATHRPISPLLSKFLYAFAVFNSALSPYLYGYFSFNVGQELELLLCCVIPCHPSNPANVNRASSLVARRRAIRQRPTEHSTTNNSTSPLGNNSMSATISRRSLRNAGSAVLDSRTARVRRLSPNTQTCSFDDTAATPRRRPSRLSPPLSRKGSLAIQTP